MGHVERTSEIKAPVEKVWAIVTDLERIPEWAKDVKKEEITSKQRSGVGTTFREVGVMYGRRYELDAEMTEFVENKKFAFRTTSGTKWKGSWTLKPTKAGTQLTYAADYNLGYSIFGKIFDKLSFHGRMEKRIDGWMENIKSLTEK